MKNNTFERGMQAAAAAIEASVVADASAFFDCVEEANELGVDPEVVLAAKAAAVAAQLYAELDDNMNPQRWA